MAVLLLPAFYQMFDDDGNPLSGGKIRTYAAGTTSPKNTFTDASGATAASNPVMLDAAGRPTHGGTPGDVWGLGSYNLVLLDAEDNVIRTVPNVSTFTTIADAEDAFWESFTATASQTTFTLSEDLGTDEKTIMVFDNGIIQPPTSYTLNGTSLVFAVGRTSGHEIQVWAPSRLAGSASAAAALAEEFADNASTYADAASASADSAAAHDASAEGWADEAEAWATKMDGPVEPGKYSAEYWAQYAEEISVPDGSIDNSKMANMPANTIKMRSDAVTGVPQDIVIAANKFLARASTGNAVAKDISDYALSLLALTSASAMRSSLSVPSFATGTFTPAVTGTTTAGTATYSNQQGLYIQIGNRVFCDIYVNYSAGTGTGNMLITGLPFTSASYACASVPYTQNIATGAASTYPMAITTPGSSAITLFREPVAGGAASPHPYDAAGEVLLSINYQV